MGSTWLWYLMCDSYGWKKGRKLTSLFLSNKNIAIPALMYPFKWNEFLKTMYHWVFKWNYLAITYLLDVDFNPLIIQGYSYF